MSADMIHLVSFVYFVGGLFTILALIRLAGLPENQGAIIGYAYVGAMWPVYWLLVLLMWPRGKNEQA